jgi:hypothetical protein
MMSASCLGAVPGAYWFGCDDMASLILGKVHMRAQVTVVAAIQTSTQFNINEL